jgi:hypothetical protein
VYQTVIRKVHPSDLDRLEEGVSNGHTWKKSCFCDTKKDSASEELRPRFGEAHTNGYNSKTETQEGQPITRADFWQHQVLCQP